jgi:hypothetical protein
MDSTGHNMTMFFEEAELPYRVAREGRPYVSLLSV